MNTGVKLQATIDSSLLAQLRAYDTCFEEFLRPDHNGQKHMQAILLREAFERFARDGVGIQGRTPTNILDVSCGPGEYSAAWTTSVARFIPKIRFSCTDFPGGVCKDTGERYTAATTRKIREAGEAGKLPLAGDPLGIEANLFSGTDAIMPEHQKAHIIHWSHSGYHVRDALGAKKDDAQAIEKGLHTAIEKMWEAMDDKGILLSIHQSGDAADALPSEMFPVAHKYLGVLDDVPARVAGRISKVGGYIGTVILVTPLEFPNLADEQWEALTALERWEALSADQERVLRLLAFVGYDFSDSGKSGLEKLAGTGRLADFIHEYRALVKQNGGFINVKCAFQLASKSEEVARTLDRIASELQQNMPGYVKEMRHAMDRELKGAQQTVSNDTQPFALA